MPIQPPDGETVSFDVEYCRRQFPGLARQVNGRPAIFFDGPAGSQVPQRVIAAVSGYLAETNANHGGVFATSRQSDRLLAEAHRAVADLVGTDDPGEIVFGANMTTLTFALSRAIARTWKAGDEVVVMALEHDANVTPWVLAARDAGAMVRRVTIDPSDGTLELADLRAKITPRTKLVAIGCASNAIGTINPVTHVARLAHEVGALVFLDAVHYAPHALMDVRAWDCDLLACSAYKFFGPHVGILWGRRQLLEALTPYKVRPCSEALPDRWMTGTQNHEGIAGTLAAIEYLADLGLRMGSEVQNRRQSLVKAFMAIGHYERQLTARLLAGLAENPSLTIWGITDPRDRYCRVPTVAVTHCRLKPLALAERLADRGIFVWHGNFYALPLTEALGLEPDGAVRIGLMHYHTAEEVDRLLAELEGMDEG
jgi:cysteine desulfurase family protein (TIGR01976 family)